ncbi:fatty acid desaturase family protein [Aquihabitans sp. McL0605]|uniref:fatty acid desaturase family protein n=1 Tax=Aquihabitans sp. McL0605 TaxID=3415671 RepID=UPI003CEBF42F
MPVPTAAAHLSREQIDALGAELDALRQRTEASLGERDRNYLEQVVRAQRGLEFAGRALLFAGFLPPAWVGGTSALALSKILDNMEIGHNVMHGQYDFLQDPAFQGTTFEWDTSCPADQWRHSHNYRHHTFTNVIGEDRDLGYGVLRIDAGKPWKPKDLGNPIYAALLASFFQYGVMLHDLEVERIVKGKVKWSDTEDLRRAMARKLGSQTLKDYVLWPLLTGPSAPFTLAANATANLARNLWSFTIIFCGHFPDGVATFTREEAADESRGGWYLRQLLGSANIDGGPLLHLMSGNLSFQIEHHLFPDIPAHRYPELAVEVREICERYGLPYNTGGLVQQFGSVVSKIVRFALPWSTGATPPAPAPDPTKAWTELDLADRAEALTGRAAA